MVGFTWEDERVRIRRTNLHIEIRRDPDFFFPTPVLVVGAPLISLTSVLRASRSLVSWWVSAMVSVVQSLILSSHLSI